MAIICYALLKSEKNKQGPIISFLCSLLAMDMSDQLNIGQRHLAGKGSLNFAFQKNQQLAKIFTLIAEVMETTEVGIRSRNFCD